jgi:hypothetical protein
MTIEIQQLALQCRVPEALAGDPLRASTMLDKVLGAARTDLAAAVAQVFAGDNDDERVVFIDRLDFELAVNVDYQREHIARVLAAQLARCVWSQLSAPTTVSFRDRVELLARFMLDLSIGAAYTKPWHDAFLGLKPLSTSGIVRTLLEQNPHEAVQALGRLSQGDLARMLGTLTGTDAGRCVAAVVTSSRNPCREPERIAAAVVEVGNATSEGPRHQLALLVALCRNGSGDGDATTLALAALLDALAHGDAEMIAAYLGEGGDSATEAWVREAAEARLLEAAKSGLIPLPTLAARREYVATHRTGVVNAIEQLRQRVTRPTSAVEWRLGHGGIWLLLPQVLERLPADTDTLPAAYAAVTVASDAAAGEIWCDRALRTLLGVTLDDDELIAAVSLLPAYPRIGGRVEPPFGAGMARPWSRCREDFQALIAAAEQLGLPRTPAVDLARLAYVALRGYARRLPGFAASSNGHLWRNFLATPASVNAAEDTIRVELDPPPLDLVWRISGAGRADFALPDGRRVLVDVRR